MEHDVKDVPGVTKGSDSGLNTHAAWEGSLLRLSLEYSSSLPLLPLPAVSISVLFLQGA